MRSRSSYSLVGRYSILEHLAAVERLAAGEEVVAGLEAEPEEERLGDEAWLEGVGERRLRAVGRDRGGRRAGAPRFGAPLAFVLPCLAVPLVAQPVVFVAAALGLRDRDAVGRDRAPHADPVAGVPGVGAVLPEQAALVGADEGEPLAFVEDVVAQVLPRLVAVGEHLFHEDVEVGAWTRRRLRAGTVNRRQADHCRKRPGTGTLQGVHEQGDHQGNSSFGPTAQPRRIPGPASSAPPARCASATGAGAFEVLQPRPGVRLEFPHVVKIQRGC